MAGAENARPPGFPSVEELKELNREIHEDAGFPEHFELDQRSPLDGCLAEAQAAYAATPDGVIQTAALLAHGIAPAQAFRDGNRRTAYVATRTFLYGAGYGHLRRRRERPHVGAIPEPGGRAAEGRRAWTEEVRNLVQATTRQPQASIEKTRVEGLLKHHQIGAPSMMRR